MPDAVYRMADDQLPEVLSLLAASGSTARSVETWKSDHMTALLLGPHHAGKPQGSPTAAMPLARRTLAVAPGRTLQAGWLSANAFASRMGLRRATRNSALRWPELLPDLDALVVVRRDEPSLAARWYQQTGFSPVLAIRCLYLSMDSPPAAPARRFAMKVAAPAELKPWEPQMLAVHRDVFSAYGGHVQRDGTFWSRTLAAHFYREHYQFQVISLWAPDAPDTLMGYAVVGWSQWHSKRPRMDILELATRQWDASVAEELLRTAGQLAWSKGVHDVRAVIAVHDPYRSHLLRTGFVDQWGYVMLARWLHPQRYIDRIHAAAALTDTAFQLNAPGHVPVTLGSHAAPLALEADPATLTRLLLQRVEVSSALHEGTLVALNPAHGRDAAARLAMALPWTPWVFHMLDFI